MIALFNEIFSRPILNLLIFLYDLFGNNIGFAIIGVTVVIRLILYPSFHSALKSQKALQDLQPQMEEIKKQHQEDKQAQMEALMKLYQEKKVNPLSSCLPLLVQLPVILALFWVLNTQLRTPEIEGLYGFVTDPGVLDPFWLSIDMGGTFVPLALLAATLQFFQTRMIQAKNRHLIQEKMAKMMQTQMLYVLPVITFVVAVTLPAGLSLYWSVSTLFAIGQQWLIIKQQQKEA